MEANYKFTEKEKDVIKKLLEATYNMITLNDMPLDTHKEEIEELEKHGIIKTIGGPMMVTYSFSHYSMPERLKEYCL